MRRAAWLLLLCLAGSYADAGGVECSGEYVPGVIQTLKQTPKSGFGVLFVANHGDPEQHKHFLHLAVQSAQSYARASPQLPLALITNAHPRDLPGAWPLRAGPVHAAHMGVVPLTRRRRPQRAARSRASYTYPAACCCPRSPSRRS